MRYFAASNGQEQDAWSILPPTLKNGDQIPAAKLIDTSDFSDEQLVFQVGRQGQRTDLTFFYWQAFIATESGRKALEGNCRSKIWFSPACTNEGDELWVVRAPHLHDIVDINASRIDQYPIYSPRHPLAHLSGTIRSFGGLRLRRDKVQHEDMFYIQEYPMLLIISETLLHDLRKLGISGVGRVEYPVIELTV